MEIKINKEIRSYKETVYFGLTARQLICSLLAVGTAVWRSPTELASRQPQGRCGMEMNRGQRNSSALYFSCLGFPTFQHLARDHRCTDKVCGINFQSVRNVKEHIQREVVCRSGRFDDAQK